jgi:hypothetical protein
MRRKKKWRKEQERNCHGRKEGSAHGKKVVLVLE